MGWTAHFETETTEPVTEPHLVTMADELADHAGSCSGEGTRYSATFSIEDESVDPVEIMGCAEAIYRGAVRNAGLLVGMIVSAKVTTWGEHDRELGEPAYPELAGIAEVAEMFGVSRQRASALQTREGFPQPLAVLASGPVWPKAWLTRFADEWERKPGRPRKSDAA